MPVAGDWSGYDMPLVTIVFTDLVDSCRINSSLPGEDDDARNRAFLDTIKSQHDLRIMGELEASGGRVANEMGDGFYLEFDNPVKAARWAANVQQSHREQPIDTPFGPLEVKIGLHIGTPLPFRAGRTDHVGQEVSYAARLCALARGGMILISEPLAALIRSARLSGLTIHDHGLQDLKGLGRAPVYELIRAGQGPGVLPRVAVSPTNLPPPPVTFIGREDLLARIERGVRAGGVTVLKGEGGAGKTALALKFAHDARAAGELPGGVAWVNCEPGPGREECLRQMAFGFFGARMEHESIESCLRRVALYLDRGDALVVFDNFETICEDSEIVQWLADLRSPARALVTTREFRGRVDGRVIEIKELLHEEARELFLERANRAGADLTGQETEIDPICTTVGCHPLAIELLSARAALVPLHLLLERVRIHPDIPGPFRSRGDERHATVRRCFAWSFGSLSAPARLVLHRMCVLPDGVSGAAITAVLRMADWIEAAEELVAASVWRLSGRRYTVHPLVRALTLEQLGSKRGDFERHAARALAQFLSQKGGEVDPDDLPALVRALDWCEAELRNLVAAADFSFAAGDWENVFLFSTALFHFFQIRGHWSDSAYLGSLALAATRHANDRVGQAHSLNRLGWVYRQQGRWTEAEASHRASLKLWRELGDRRNEGHTLKHLGRMLQLHGSLDESMAACEAALALLRDAGDPVGEAKTLAYLGNIYRFQGRSGSAVEVYEQALEISRKARDRYDEGELLRRLGQVYHEQGRLDAAQQSLQRSLAIWRGFDDRYNKAVVLDVLGAVLRDDRRYSESESMLRLSLAVFQEFGDRRKEGGAVLNLARLAAARGEQEAALDLGRQAVAMLEQTEDRWLLGQARAFVAARSGTAQPP